MYAKFINKLYSNRLLMHVLFWVAVTIFFFFVFHHPGETPWRTIRNSFGFMPAHMLFAYSLSYFIFPKYVLRRKIASACLGLFVVLTIALFYMVTVDVFWLNYSNRTLAGVLRHPLFNIFSPRSIFALFSTGWIAASIKLVKRWYEEKETQQRLEKEKLIVELQLLKSQLHPHFLFNTLNSLYSLTLDRSQQAPELVLKLASLLRYILYECNESYILLDKEIENIRNYMELEQSRFCERLDISLSFTGDTAGRSIAPLLLLPFIENSIKHGTSEQLEKSWIHLHLHVENDLLTFKLINNRDEEPQTDAEGLGLRNVQRRLQLLYPGLHTLKLTPEDDTYMVFLTIALPERKEAPRPLTLLKSASHATQVSYS